MNADHECSICFSPFNRGRRSPRLLPCDHCFCETCLRAMAKYDFMAGTMFIPCPHCRGVTPLVAGLEGLGAQLQIKTALLEEMEANGLLPEEGEEEEEEAAEQPNPPAPGPEERPLCRRRRWRRVVVRVMWLFLDGLAAGADGEANRNYYGFMV